MASAIMHPLTRAETQMVPEFPRGVSLRTAPRFLLPYSAGTIREKTEAPVTDKATIQLGDANSLEVPTVVGTEGERALDVAQLRAKTGYVTLDPAFMNTASTKSAITFIDGDKGILRYRGIPIEQLAEKSTFVETAYLLIYGELPSEEQLRDWSHKLTHHSLLHEDMKHFFEGFSPTAHPMAILSAMVAALSSYYPDSLDADNVQHRDITIARLVSKVRTIA